MPQILPSRSTVKLKADSILTIFTACQFSEPADENEFDGNRTPSSTEDYDNNLTQTRYLFLREVKEFDVDEASFDTENPSDDDFRKVVEYSVESSARETILIANQIVGAFDQTQSRPPINYMVHNCNGETLLTVDGKDEICGMQILLKGQHHVVRGKVSSHGLFGYAVKDFLTGSYYKVSIPYWLIICACIVFCTHPTLEFKKVPPDHFSRPSGSSSDQVNNKEKGKRKKRKQKKPAKKNPQKIETVAIIGKRKWEGTLYADQIKFAVYYVNEEESSDSKLFIFSAALVLFHLFFKTKKRAMRCLVSYIMLLLTLGILIIALLFIIIEAFYNNE